jgi:hypothetical protein
MAEADDRRAPSPTGWFNRKSTEKQTTGTLQEGYEIMTMLKGSREIEEFVHVF